METNFSVNQQGPQAEEAKLHQRGETLDHQKIALLEKSYGRVFNLFMSLDCHWQNFEMLLKSEKFIAKLRLLFKYYRPRSSEEKFSLSGKKILNRDLSEGLTRLITEVSSNLNLSLENTFEIAEIMFENDPVTLENFMKKESIVNFVNFNAEFRKTLPEEKIIEIGSSFIHICDSLKYQIQETYYDERSSLLEIIRSFLTYSINTHETYANKIKNLLCQLNNSINYLRNSFWDSYLTYDSDTQSFSSERDRNPLMQTLQNLDEQTRIVGILLLLNRFKYSERDSEFFVKVLKRFSEERFLGYFDKVQNHFLIDIRHQEIIKAIELYQGQIIFYLLDYLHLKKIGKAAKVKVNEQKLMPFGIFTNKENFEALQDIFQNFKYIQNFPIFQAIYSIGNYLSKESVTLPFKVAFNLAEALQSLLTGLEPIPPERVFNYFLQLFNSEIFNTSRTSWHDYQTILIKSWVSAIYIYLIDFNHSDETFIKLCVRCLDSEASCQLFWTDDFDQPTPFGILFGNLLNDFPNHLEWILEFCHVLKGSDPTFQINLWRLVNSLEIVTLVYREDEIDTIREGLDDIIFEGQPRIQRIVNGVEINQSNRGTIITQPNEEYRNYVVRFQTDKRFSLFRNIYEEWKFIIKFLNEYSEMPLRPEIEIKINLLILFLDLVRSDPGNIIELFKNFDSEVHSFDPLNFPTNFKIFFEHFFLTLNILTKNETIYKIFSELTLSLLRMLSGLLKFHHLRTIIIQVILDFFLEPVSSKLLEEDRSYQKIYSHGHYSAATRDMMHQEHINFLKIVAQIINIDYYKNLTKNTEEILEIISYFFAFPDILNFARSKTACDFLLYLGGEIVFPFINILSKGDYFKPAQFKFISYLLEIVTSCFSLFLTTKEKLENYHPDEELSNPLYETVIQILNSSDTPALIFKILRTRIVKQESKKDNLSSSNYEIQSLLFYSLKTEKNVRDSYYYGRDLLKSAFDCLNTILDLLLVIKTSKRENIEQLLRIKTLRQWTDTIVIGNSLPEIGWSISRENYNISFLLNLFAYVDFEMKEDFKFKESIIFNCYKSEFSLDLIREKFASEFESHYFNSIEFVLHDCKKKRHNNICTKALAAINRILVLLKSRTLERNNNLQLLLIARKHSDSYMKVSIDLSSEIKQSLLKALKLGEGEYVLEILNFLIECADSQPNFLAFFLDDKTYKESFWNFLRNCLTLEVEEYKFGDSIEKEITLKSKEMVIDRLLLLFSNILLNEVNLKKVIREILTTYSSELEKLIKIFLKIFSPMFYKKIEQNFQEASNLNKYFNLFILEQQVKLFGQKQNSLNALCQIFAKLLAFTSDESFLARKNFPQLNLLKDFLSTISPSLLNAYHCKINTSIIQLVNSKLVDKNDNYRQDTKNEKEILELRNSMNPHTWHQFNYKYEQKAIQVSNDYYLTTTLEDSPLAYSLNYHIDLKEFYTLLEIKNYNKYNLLAKFLSPLAEYNLSLCIFEAQSQTMFSMTYLSSLIFSIGTEKTLDSTHLFTGRALLYPEATKQVLSIYKEEHPKLNFSLDDFSSTELTLIIEKNILEQLDLSYKHFIQTSENIFNPYSTLLLVKYDFINHVLTYLKYLYRTNKERINIQILLKSFHEMSQDLPIFINNSNVFLGDNLILCILKLFIAIIDYFLITLKKDQESVILTVENEIVNFTENLISLAEKISTFDTIIITLFTGYIRVAKFFRNSHQELVKKIISMMIKKVSLKAPPQEYFGVLNFFSQLVDHHDNWLDLFFSEKILSVFIYSDMFNSRIEEYQENERSASHLLWCSTLIFFDRVAKNLVLEEETLMKTGEGYAVLEMILEMILNNEERILNILSDTEYINRGGNYIQKSLAFLEEMEYVTDLIHSVFALSPYWKESSDQNFNLHNRLADIILSATLLLFSPNVKLNNHYKPISQVEKRMESLHVDSSVKTGSLQTSYHYSPQKKYKSDFGFGFSGLDSLQASNSFETGLLNPSLQVTPLSHFQHSIFYFRVEQGLNKILYNSLSILKYALGDSYSKNSYSIYLKNLFTRPGPNTPQMKIFDDMCRNLVYGLYYAIHFMDSLNKNLDINRKLWNLSQSFYNTIKTSIELGYVNLHYVEEDFEDLFDPVLNSLISYLKISHPINELLKYFKNFSRFNFDNQIKEVTLKKFGQVRSTVHETYLNMPHLKEAINIDRFIESVRIKLEQYDKI